jgi:F0F1-type ATP synthase membrane subunit c/vacuolar-type H+-ATPase subunit K
VTEAYPPPGSPTEPPPAPASAAPPPPPYPASAGTTAGMPQPGTMVQGGPVGQIRGTGFAILIFIVTFGIYGWYWYYKSHQEMKDHSGQGIGGGIALLLAILVGIAMPYVTSNEVGNLYTRRGQQAPVSAATGLWNFPGVFIVVGPIIWFVKTNRALNDYWASLGATP